MHTQTTHTRRSCGTRSSAKTWRTTRKLTARSTPSSSQMYSKTSSAFASKSTNWIRHTTSHPQPLPGMACCKVTEVEIELLTDPDMYLFFEEGIRGGVTSAMKRYSKANNVYMKDYDPEKPDKFIEYLDKNSLYATMLCKPLPIGKFKWITPEDISEMMDDHSKIKFCTLKVEIEYPKELHDSHNDYPLAPEWVTVNGEEKLIPNLYDKEKYVVHHETLRCYLKYGIKLTKIHSGISYDEQDFMKKFIEINAEARTTLQRTTLRKTFTNL